eukprot:scaffold47301_cov36-Phaeocystis_antarctica.AAC.1
MCTLLTTYRALKDVVALVRGLSLLDERLARLELLLLADAREDFLRSGRPAALSYSAARAGLSCAAACLACA